MESYPAGGRGVDQEEGEGGGITGGCEKGDEEVKRDGSKRRRKTKG